MGLQGRDSRSAQSLYELSPERMNGIKVLTEHWKEFYIAWGRGGGALSDIKPDKTQTVDLPASSNCTYLAATILVWRAGQI